MTNQKETNPSQNIESSAFSHDQFFKDTFSIYSDKKIIGS